MKLESVEPELKDRISGTWMEKILEGLEELSLDE